MLSSTVPFTAHTTIERRRCYPSANKVYVVSRRYFVIYERVVEHPVTLCMIDKNGDEQEWKLFYSRYGQDIEGERVRKRVLSILAHQ